VSNIIFSFFLLFWRAPLGVHSAKSRHQSPEWTILSHVNCFFQGIDYRISGPAG